MPLTFHPNPGTIVVCNYATGFIEPEMVKRRLVAVVSPRLRNRGGLCTVIPLSTTDPAPVMDYHHRVRLMPAPPHPWAAECWAKCDMVAAVSLGRLEPIRRGKDRTGRRIYADIALSADDLLAVRRCVVRAIGMDSLLLGP